VSCIHPDAIGRDGKARTLSADAEGVERLRDAGLGVQGDLSYTLKSGAPPAVSFAENQRGEVLENETVGALKVGGGKRGQGYPAVRLGGDLPDAEACAFDPLPDGRRYAACGDGVAAPVATWIALRLAQHIGRRAASR
jgi:hypothetical protein